jgi:hypothetical protein
LPPPPPPPPSRADFEAAERAAGLYTLRVQFTPIA